MSRYQISMQRAKKLQKWALKVSRAEELLKNVPKIPNTKKIKPGIYVSYEIDKNELDDGIDWPAPAVATVYAVIKDNNFEFLGELRAYNWEAYWLSTNEDDEVDTAENWMEIINKDYNELLISKETIK